MAETLSLDRRVFGEPDRRHLPRGGGRRAEDQHAPELDIRIPCEACGIAWASLSAFTHARGESMACYICPRCGYLERRVAAPGSQNR